MTTSYVLQILKKNRTKKRKLMEMVNHPKTEKKDPFGQENVNACRICLKTGIISIYSSNMLFNAEEAIKKLGDIEIQKDDNYPKHLCETCHSLLSSAVLFRNLAQESDRILRHTNRLSEIEDESDFSHVEPENIHRCGTCDLTFNTVKEYSTHKASKHHKNVRIQCPVCHRLITTKLYKNHQKRHASASHLVCEVCGKLYRKDNLIRHLQLHTHDLPFQCQLCPYRGRFLESLKIHMRIHSGEKPFPCDQCEVQFATRSNLNRHLLTHRKEKPHKCVECGRSFYTQRDLDGHSKSDHSGVNEFCCKLCGNKYSTRKALMRHELRVHKRVKMAKGRMPLYLQAEYRKTGET